MAGSYTECKGLKHAEWDRQRPMLVYGDKVTLENKFQTHSQCRPMEEVTLAATLALPLMLGLGYPEIVISKFTVNMLFHSNMHFR